MRVFAAEKLAQCECRCSGLAIPFRTRPKTTFHIHESSRNIFFENPAMVQFVSGDDPSQGPYTDFIFIRHTTPQPHQFIEITKQRHCGATHGNEILDQIWQRTCREGCVANVVVLLENLPSE